MPTLAKRGLHLMLAAVMVTTGLATVTPSPAEAAYSCATRVTFTGYSIVYRLTGRGANSGIYYFEGRYGTTGRGRDRYYTSRNPYEGAKRPSFTFAGSMTFYGGRWHVCRPVDPTP